MKRHFLLLLLTFSAFAQTDVQKFESDSAQYGLKFRMTMVDPNNIHKTVMTTNGLNMTGGQMVDIVDFPPQAVKREFMPITAAWVWWTSSTANSGKATKWRSSSTCTKTTWPT